MQAATSGHVIDASRLAGTIAVMRRTVSLSVVLLLAIAATGSAAVGQGDASTSVAPHLSPPAAASPHPSASPATGTVTLDFEQPGWQRITTARSPAAREDHTWTVDSDGRYAYLFGGRDRGKDFDDLWRYDLEADRWEMLSPRGRSPRSRFGHSAVWVDGRGLIIFAGQAGAEFLGDLWQFDPDKGTWSELPADGAAPKARYGSCMVLGRDGRLWISHGFTFAGRFDDTRAYNLQSRRWASIAPDGRRPGERCLHDCFTDASGELVLYGGQNDSERALGDLWVTRRNGSWQKLANPKLGARRLYAVTEAGDDAYVFGGADKDDGALDDLWRIDRETLKSRRVRVDGPGPAARYAGTLITDAARGRLLLFGGQSSSARDDVWALIDLAADPREVTAHASPPADAGQRTAPSLSPEDEPVGHRR